MAVAGYKLRINGGTFVDVVIDVGNTLFYLITGLTSGVLYGVEVAAYDNTLPFPLQSGWSPPVYATPGDPTVVVDASGKVTVDGSGKAAIVFI